MIAFQMQDIKAFMSRLLLSSAFDAFLVVEGGVTTFSSFQIDGRLRPDYYSREEQEASGLEGRRFARWQEIRPFCLELIKGKHTPLSFHFTFQLSPENTEKLLRQSDSSFSPADVNGLVLNIRFENGSLTCTTGTSLNVFTLDKSLDQAWDRMVQKFFLQQNLSFTLP